MRYPVVIVDDEETDRLIARKRFDRSKNADRFTVMEEYSSGDSFIEIFTSRRGHFAETSAPVLVLMDINMPGRNGFETIEEMESVIACGDADGAIVLMVFSSSQNTKDIERARSLGLVSGYIVKPFDEVDIVNILEFMDHRSPEFLMPKDRLAPGRRQT